MAATLCTDGAESLEVAALLKCIPAFSKHLASFYPGSWAVIQVGGTAHCSNESLISVLIDLTVSWTW